MCDDGGGDGGVCPLHSTLFWLWEGRKGEERKDGVKEGRKEDEHTHSHTQKIRTQGKKERRGGSRE